MLKRCCSTHQKNARWQACLGMRGLNITPHPERSTGNHSLDLPRVSLWVDMVATEVLPFNKKKRYDFKAEGSGRSHEWKKKAKEVTRLQSSLEHGQLFFWGFVRSDAPERSGRGDTFSSAKTPLVIHIKTKGRAAEVEKEKSYWCGTNSFWPFFFFFLSFISLKQTQGRLNGKQLEKDEVISRWRTKGKSISWSWFYSWKGPVWSGGGSEGWGVPMCTICSLRRVKFWIKALEGDLIALQWEGY